MEQAAEEEAEQEPTPAAVAPTTPAQQPNVRKAKEPAAGALDALNDRNKELEDMLDE